MRLLVITPYYSPLENPRAYRWSMIVSQMIAKGWQVDVVTACDRLNDSPDRPENIHRIGYSTPDKRFTSRPTPDRFTAHLEPLKKIYRRLQWPDESSQWIKKGWTLAHDILLKNKHDAVITVSWPFSTHLIGLKIKSAFDLPWLADIGDPFLLPITPQRNNFKIYKKKSLAAEKQVLTKSDHTVVTTDQLMDVYHRFTGFGPARLSVIPPMLSPEPLHRSTNDNQDNLLRIGYFGSFYEKVRSPKMMATFVRELQNLPSSMNMVLLMHGHYKPHDVRLIQDLFKDVNIQLSLKPWIPRNQVRGAMASMDLLLSIGNYATVQVPSKIVDYSASGIPILHLQQIEDDPCLPYLHSNPDNFVFTTDKQASLRDFLNRLLPIKDKPTADFGKEDWAPEHIANRYMNLILKIRSSRV